MIQNSKTFAFSAENPTGVRAGGSQGGDCTKLRPTVTIHAGETVTLVDAAGPGVIQHMWFTGYVGHHFIIRMYWDDQEYPSVEAPLSAFFGCAYDENFVDRDGKYPVLNSAMMLVAPGRGYNSYFEMPFHKRARITMENLLLQKVCDNFLSLFFRGFLFSGIPESSHYTLFSYIFTEHLLRTFRQFCYCV